MYRTKQTKEVKMKINKIRFKNFKSVGGKWSEIKFPDSGLILINGKNGSGKCCRKDTVITVQIDDKYKDLLKQFTDTIVTKNK